MAGIEIQAERTAASAEAVVAKMERDAGGGGARRGQRRARARRASPASARRSTPARDGARRRGRGRGEAARSSAPLIGEADGAAAQLVEETGPELIEALVRVREAAQPGGEPRPRGDRRGDPGERRRSGRRRPRARSARRSSEPVQEQLAEIGNASHLALAAAQAASERLTRQLLTIGETAAAIEERIAEDRAEREEQGGACAVAARVADHRRAQFDRDRRHQDPLERGQRRGLGRLSQGRPRRLHPARGAAARIRARRARSCAIMRTSRISATR